MGSTNIPAEKRRMLALALVQTCHNGNRNSAHARRTLEAAKQAGVTYRDLIRAKVELGLPGEDEVTDDSNQDGAWEGIPVDFSYEPNPVSFDDGGRAIHGRKDPLAGEHDDR